MTDQGPLTTPPGERLWNVLGRLLMPRWLYHGPQWWRSFNASWLRWWGAAFFYTAPWRPFSRPKCDHDWQYDHEESQVPYSGYIERCSKCGALSQVPQ